MPSHPHLFRAAGLAFTLAVAGACSSAVAPHADIELRTASTTIQRPAGGTADVAYTVSNSGTEAVLLNDRCDEHLTPAVERRSANRWEEYATGLCIAILHTGPVSLAAGERRDDVVAIAEAGTYRLVLATERGSVVSAAFTVH